MQSQNFIRNFVIISHIDHGKSTLADRFLELTGTVDPRKMHPQYLDQMPLEQERGITIKMQPVRMAYRIWHMANRQSGLHTARPSNVISEQLAINDKHQVQDFILNLIDTPGHVDFSYEVSRALAAVEGAILLVDATKGIQAQTMANLRLAQKQGLVVIPAVNKIDLSVARVTETRVAIAEVLGEKDLSRVFCISAKDGTNVRNLLDDVMVRIPRPKGDSEEPLRALIFDSRYDAFQGVIAYVRIVDGSVRKGDKLRFMQASVEGEALDCGFFEPELISGEGLSAGEIGWIATGLKDIHKCRVGDTITAAYRISHIAYRKSSAVDYHQNNKQLAINNKPLAPLPGYQEPKPVVFASLYPEDADAFDALRDALAKLKLNDAALQWQPESSSALGRGFRCGFLGMLHLEVALERIRREYGVSVIVTRPHVEYRALIRELTQTNTRLSQRKSASSQRQSAYELIRTTQEWPDSGSRSLIEEPWIKLEIFTPAEYIGAISQLIRQGRGLTTNTNMSPNSQQIILYAELPLSEIMGDFTDRLKSITSGWASFSYEPIGYRAADLVKVDILIAGEEVPELAMIVPETQGYQEGRRITRKLKESLPAEQFALSLQAAIGGKIIARETIHAMRKDVTGYLYGGDYTRKRKLLEKQKRGKRRLRTFGRVRIQPKVFLDLLKR